MGDINGMFSNANGLERYATIELAKQKPYVAPSVGLSNYAATQVQSQVSTTDSNTDSGSQLRSTQTAKSTVNPASKAPITVTIDNQPKSKKGMYIGIGIGVAVLGVIGFFVFRKK